ncbi:MAG: leucine-rich repeat protein, partial [Muribaculaceae bacterium]|nr:leucine-rich repeat protein [Muribaculaceae bacterium]
MIKRLFYRFLTLVAALTALHATAQMYIVGDAPFGNWSLTDPATMTDNGDGTYSFTAPISGTVYFIFADGLVDDWDTFSSNYRYGPTTVGQGETVESDRWVTTQRSTQEAYIFKGDGSTYRITFDKNNLRFKITRNFYDFVSDGFYFTITSDYTVKLVNSGKYASDYSGNVTIPSYVTHEGMTYTVTAIGREAFYSCHQLTWVNIPTTVTTIENSAFYYCTGLTKVEIPESVVEIGDWNFYCSDELTTVILPSTLTTMGHDCFGSCPKLSKVTCKATTPPSIGQNCFAEPYTTKPTLYVPESAINAYQAIQNWSTYFSSITTMVDYDFTYMNLKFVITSPTTAKCIGPAITNPSGGWSIPNAANGYMVTEVGDNAFLNCTHITSMSLGDNVEKVGPYAFYLCTGMTTLNLGSVKVIDDAAFGDCTALTSVYLPNTLQSLGHYAFGGCGLTSVNIPGSVVNIIENPFYNCTALTEINTLEHNEYYESLHGVLYNKSITSVIAYPAGKNDTEYTILGNVTTIGSHAFGYSKLQRVILPPTLTGVGYLAFSFNDALTTVVCQAQTPPAINGYAFESTIENDGIKLMVPKGCKSAYQAARVWQDFPNIVEMNYDFMVDGIYYKILSSSPATVEVTYRDTDYNSYHGVVNVPASVTHGGVTYTVTAIGNSAFRKCDDLTSLTLPNTITEIKPLAFYYCDGLTSLDIPNSVTTIQHEAFWICRGLTHVTIPNSVTSIGYDAFRNCSALSSVVIGKNVATIGQNCFLYDPLLTEITCLGETPPAVSNTTHFFSLYEGVTLRVPYGSHEAYRNTAPWSELSHIVSEQTIEPALLGDVNGDGLVNISDVTSLINLLLKGNNQPGDHPAADVNGDSQVNISDVTSLINKLLKGDTGTTTGGTARTDFLINSVPFTMVKVDDGTFMMGLDNDASATPVHQVTLSDYSIGETEVTQALWQTVMGSNPSFFSGDVNLPVENMNWNDCQTFVSKLSQLTGKNFGLPTEAQWEFAARGGNKSQGYTYPGSNDPGEVAWYQANSGNKTHPVGTKAPNELGLYDMAGNVFEWCQDYWGSYTSAAQTDPQGPTSG